MGKGGAIRQRKLQENRLNVGDMSSELKLFSGKKFESAIQQ